MEIQFTAHSGKNIIFKTVKSKVLIIKDNKTYTGYPPRGESDIQKIYKQLYNYIAREDASILDGTPLNTFHEMDFSDMLACNHLEEESVQAWR